jgi:hypothetical protein
MVHTDDKERWNLRLVRFLVNRLGRWCHATAPRTVHLYTDHSPLVHAVLSVCARTYTYWKPSSAGEFGALRTPIAPHPWDHRQEEEQSHVITKEITTHEKMLFVKQVLLIFSCLSFAFGAGVRCGSRAHGLHFRGKRGLFLDQGT